MKTLFWKRLVAGLGTAAMLLTNVADIMPAVAYAAEADGEVVEEIVTDDATDAETPDDPELEPEGEELQEEEEAPDEEPQDEDPAEEGEETVVYGTAVFDGRPIRGYEEITLDPAGQESFRDLAPSIGGYAFAGAELDDGTVVTDLVAEDNGSFTIYSCITENGGSIALSGETCITLDYEKLVHITASVIDSFKNPIDEKFTDIELPKFDDELILNDPDNAPYDKVRSKTGSIGLISTYSPDYDFVQATVYGEMITSIIKEEIENTGDYVYYYTLDNGDRVKFLEDATVYMEYSGADSVDASYSYADSELQLRAELEDPAAVPDDAALTVTRVEADTAGYSYGAYMDALTASNDALFSSNTILYDIAFLREGWEIEPANGSVKISLTLLQQQLSKGLGAEAGSEIAVNHLTITPEKRKAFTTTAAATGLEAEDIICDQIDTAAAVLGSDKDILEFSVDSLSVIAVSRVDRDAYNQASGNGKAVRLNAAVVNDIHNVLSDNYAALDLPEFTDILVLDDPSKAPVAKVRTVNKKIGLITTWVNYSYVGAFLNGEAIRSLKKTELPEGGCSYSYLPMEGDEWKALEEDATVLFEYAPANVARTTFEYVDNYARVTAVLEKADAIPADAELVVTLLQAGDNGYDEYMEALNRNSDEEYTEDNTLLYDIAFMVKDENGNSVEFHPEEGAVRVTIEFLEKQLTSEIEAESAQDIEVTHLMLTDSVKEKADTTLEADFSVKDVKVEPLEAVASVGTKEQVSFTAGDFSVFAIKSGGQKNTWAGSIDVSMSDVNALGGLLNFAVVANTFKSTDHVEGNVRVGSFRIPGSSANLNQDSRVTANNDIQLKVTKEDASGKGGTFSFGVFDGNNKIASFQIKANPTGSLTLDKNNYPAVITALQGGKDLKVYELDKNGNKIESKGTINGTTYSVTYEYTDSQDLEAIDASGRVGSSYLGEFRNSDGGTLSGAAGMNMFNSEMTFVGEKPQMNNNTVYFGNNKNFYINGGKLEYFTYVPTLKADIKQQIKDAEAVVKTLAKGRNGAKKGAGSLSVLNVKSTAGNLKGDLDNANFQSVAVTGMNVDGGDSSEYLLVNIDATGKASYQFNAVDSFDNKRADGDNGFSNLGSHIIYNIVQQGNGGELVPYTGKITMGAWSAGLLLAPKATVDQSGSFWIGEIIADTVTHGGQEIHQKNIHTIDNKREINVKVTNATSPEMGFEFDLYKRLVYENATDTDVEPEEWPADGFTFKVSKYIVGTDKPDINSGVESTNIPDLESDADAAHFWTGGKDKYGNTYYYAKLDKNTRSIKLRSTSKLTAEYVYNLHPQYTSPDDPAVHYAAYMYKIEEIKPDNAPANITYDNAKPRYTKIFLNVKDRGNGDYYFIEPPIVRTHNTVAELGCEAVPNQFINKYRPPTGILKVQKFFDYEEIGSTFNNGAASDYWKIRNAMKVKVSRMVDGAAVETIELDTWGDTDYTNAKTVTSSTGAVYTLRNSREQNGIIVIKTIEGLPMGTYVVEETTDGFIFDTTNKIQVSNKYTVEVSYSGEGTVTEGSRSISTVIDSATGKTVRVTNKYKKPIEGILAIHKIVVPDYGSEIVRDDLNSAILSHVQFRVTSLDDGQAFEFQGATPGWGKQVTTLTYKGREIKIHYGPFGNATWMVTGLPVGRYTVEEIADGVTFGPVQNFPDYNRITYYSVSNFENAFMIDNGGGAPNETSGIRSAAQAEDTSLLKNGQAATEDYRPQVIEAKPYKHVKNKNNTELIYLEDAEMIHIANHYSIPVAEFRAEKKLEGREWNNTDSYTFKIEPVSASFQVEGLNYNLTGTQTKQVTVNGEQTSVSIPMPAHDTVTVTKDTPDHIGVFDQVTYKFKGTYNYKIYEAVPEDADKDPAITYSDKVYDVTVTVAQVDEPLIKSYHLQFDEIHKGMMAVVSYDGNAYANIATFTFTNVYEELTEATVLKVWEDHEDAAGLRPTSLTVKLLADGQDTGKSVVLSDANNWEDTIGRLPKYTADKKEIDYTWSEQGLPSNYKLTNTGKTGTITTLTNTLKEGGFKVVKKVTSSTTADKNKEFSFTATLKESENGAVVSGTFGGKTFVKGKYSFTLKDDGKTEDFSGIPVGTYFIVEEADYSGQGFATSYEGNIGTVSEDAYPLVICTNDKSEGTLTIEKNVFNAIADDDKFSFPVKVVLADTTITQEYEAEGACNKVSFTNGVAEFTLKDTEWVKIKGLPDNMGYTVTEELTKMTDGSKFVSVVKGSTGNISSTGAAKVDIENTRKTGELEVSKELISDAAADADKEFDFTVTLSEQLTGTYGDMTFAGGVATFTLKGGESASADGLPIDMLYTVTEASAEGFELTAVTVDGAAKADKKGAGTISLKPSKVVFTNTRDTGDLKISKKLAGALSDADKDDEFEFTVTLSDDTISGTYGDMTFSAGSATVTIEGEGEKTATGLPVGIGYTITEASAEGFTLTGVTGDTGSIKKTLSVAEFINTHDSGDLEVKKTIESSTPNDLTKNFKFTVTLYQDATKSNKAGVAGTYGDMIFTDSAATFTLTNEQTATAEGLPAGIYYVVEEEDQDGFTRSVTTGLTGTIVKNTVKKAAITNTKDEGGLVVSKEVESDLTADHVEKEFTFTVTLADDTVSGTYGGMTFSGGKATFTLKDGESKTATGLADGLGYSVLETDNEGFTTTWFGQTGVIAKGATNQVKAKNVRKTGSLEVSKVLISDRTADANQQFDFTVTLNPAITGTYSSVDFTNGVATFTLTGGESKTIEGLPVGVTYTVTESEAEGFQLTGVTVDGAAKANGDGGIISVEPSQVEFTNTRDTGDLKISKTVLKAVTADDIAKTFNFNIALTGISGTKTYQAEGKYKSVTFNEGAATVELGNEEYVTVKGLPIGISYTITEDSEAGFVMTGKTGDTGSIRTELSEAAFENTRETGELDVHKIVQSSTPEDLENEEFTFTVQLDDTSIAGTYGDMTFAGGKATVVLKHDETAAATDLPAGIGYTVTESHKDGFTCIASTGVTGQIQKDATVTAEFTNKKDEGGLTVSKLVVSDIPADHEIDFNFTVTLDDKTVKGTYGGMTFNNGVATFSLADGESKSAEGLAKGIGYTVTEADSDGFTTTWEGKTGTISDEATRVARATNTRETGDLTVSKELISDRAADADQTFVFHVKVSEQLNKTYSGVEFDGDEATINLKGGESKKIEGLPVGITYKVTEESVPGFALTAKVGDEGTISTTPSTAVLTNTRDTGDLWISKVVFNPLTDDDESVVFHFRVELSDTTIGGTYGQITFADGVAEDVEIHHLETKKALGLPTGITYKITERSADGFVLKGAVGDEGSITTEPAKAVFTNTRETGDLDVTKTVVSDTASDRQVEFNYTVTLDDTSVEGTYGDMTFAGGVARFTLKHGETKQANGLPTGVGYTIVEADKDGFVLTSQSGTTGSINKTTVAHAAFTNTAKGGLVVTKSVVSRKPSDSDLDFAFTVTLDDTSINGAYGQMTFVNGKAEFTLKDGEQSLATGIPAGIGFTVEEAHADGFTTAWTGGITAGTIANGGEPQVVEAVNTRDTGDLTVSKVLVSDRAADDDYTFNFTVNVPAEINGTFGDMTFTAGEASVALKGGESATATGLPVGITYTVTEAEATGFVLTGVTVNGEAAANGNGGVISTEPSTVVFTNTRETGDLKISKKIANPLVQSDRDQKFTFTIVLSDTGISKAFEAEGAYQSVAFTGGSTTVELKHEEEVTVKGLPTGITYTITEASAPNFRLTGKTGDSGSITRETAVAEFVNTRDLGDLDVTKTVVSSTPADKTDEEFSFTVTMYRDEDHTEVEDTLAGTFTDPTATKGMTFSAGVATFTLKDGERAGAKGLPADLYYVVTETDKEGYTLTAKTGDTGHISATLSTAAFTNTKNEGGLVVSKSVVSDRPSDLTKEWHFQVVLSDTTVNGTYGEMTFTNGKAEFTLVAGEQKLTNGLKAGIGYTVTETEDGKDGITTTWSGDIEDGKIANGGEPKKVAAVNTRDKGDLKLSKVLVSDAAADKNVDFTFDIGLSEAVSGTYGDVTFTSGAAVVTLKGGESADAKGLPVGITYTITERSATGFKLTGVTVDGQTKANGDGGVISSTPSEVVFTNTRETGDLKISKAVLNPLTNDDTTTKFNFEIELKDHSITKTYQAEGGVYTSVSFDKGVADVALADGEYVLIKDLPTGVDYEITETDPQGAGFSLTGKTGDSGTITTTPAEAEFTNTRITGELSVEKHVTSSSAADKTRKFNFKVNLGDTSVAGKFGDMTFANGEATLKLADNESAQATGLPVGISYTVSEETVDGFIVSKEGETGSISTTRSLAKYTNTRDEGGLVVQKKLVSDKPADKDLDFAFTVTFKDHKDVINGTYGDMTFTDGEAKFTLKGGESKSATKLPVGATFEVTEADADGFVTTWTNEIKGGTIANTGAVVVEAVNTREKGNLDLSKVLISDAAADKDQVFTFTVKLSEAITGTYKDMAFTNGEATVTLKGGETAQAIGLPTGITYTITEASATGFVLTGVTVDGNKKNNGEGGEITTTPSVVVFTNTRETGDLQISKEVLGAVTTDDTEKKFEFTIKLDDASISKAYPAEGGVYDEVTFDKGEAGVELAADESVTITGLPTGVGYTVTEADADGFSMTGKTGDTGTISTTKSEVVFENTRQKGSLSVEKAVVSSTDADKDEEFEFTVTLYKDVQHSIKADGVDGSFGQMTFAQGKAEFKLKDGETLTATGLPVGLFYVAAEKDADGFTTIKEGETGKITATKSEAKFTNTRNEGGLVVSKSVVSLRPSDKGLDFSFTVETGNDKIDGTYGDMTFVKGKAQFTLKDSESATATGLPVGTVVTVTEKHENGFTTTWTNSITGGTIAATDTVLVQAVNTRDTGDLDLSKVLVSDAAADADQEFNFTIKLYDDAAKTKPAGVPDDTYGEVAFSGDEAHVTLKGGETAEIKGLPVGITYVITEDSVEGFTCTGKTGDTGVISSEKATAVFTNTRDTADLEVSKEVFNPLTYDDTQKKFNFTVTLNDATIDGTYGDMTFDKGVAKFTLKHTESKKAEGLPIGVGYTVTEADDVQFELKSKTGDTGTIVKGLSEAKYVNTRKTGGLKVTKTVKSSTKTDENKDFEFTVTLYKDNTYAEDKVETSINGTFTDADDMTFTKGVATFTLKHGESKLAKGLPTGIYYMVEEKADGAFVTTATGETGEIASGTTAEAAFLNTKDEGGLEVVKKVVSDRPSDKDLEFAFTVELFMDQAKTTVAAVNGTYGEMEFADGKAQFKLKDNESKLATGLAKGIYYQVTEVTPDGFTLSWEGTTTDGTGKIQEKKISVAQAVNTRDKAELILSKKLISDRTADKDQVFHFTVLLLEKLNGTYGQMKFEDGKAKVDVKANQSVKAENLPVGIGYEITEDDIAEGFKLTGKTGEKGTITKTGAFAEFTNTRDTGDLEVTKEVLNPLTYDDEQQEFHITVTLGDQGINGTYGDMTFTNGVATFTLKHKEVKTAKGLPTGITYTVTEDQIPGTFLLKGITGGTGSIKADKSVVTVTNTRNTGDLLVGKSVVSNTQDDYQKDFSFRVTLYKADKTTVEKSINKAYGGMTFNEGVAEFTLKHNETKKAEGLPTGIWYVVEELDEKDGVFKVQKTGETGEIKTGLPATASFTNTKYEGGLVVYKKVESKLTSDKTRDYSFTVELFTDKEMTKAAAVTGTYGAMIFKDGKADFTLKDGENSLAKGLAKGLYYKVTEVTPDGMTVSWKGETGSIKEDETAVVEATNKRDEGELKISKKLITERNQDKEEEFTFDIELPEEVEGSFDVKGSEDKVVFVKGKAQVRLKADQSITITGLPANIPYTISEQEKTGFQCTGTTNKNDKGTIVKEGVIVEFNNVSTLIDVKVDKVWASDKDLEVEIRFDLLRWVDGDATKQTVASKTEKLNSSTGWNGVFEGLPKYDPNNKEYRYEVTETPLAVTKDGKRVEIKFAKDIKPEEISNQMKGFGIVNTEVVNIPVKKVWINGKEEDSQIEVELYKKLPGETEYTVAKDADMKAYRLVLNKSNNWQGVFTDLPKYGSHDDAVDGKRIEYLVKELTNIPGYVTTVSKDTQDLYGFIITNTKQLTKIGAKKVWNDENNKDGKRPAKITLNLLRNGKKVDSVEVKPDAKGNWSYVWEKLDKYEGDQLITWSVTEDAVSEYATAIKSEVVDENGDKYVLFTIDNSYTPKKTSVTVTKDWEDYNDADGTRPKSIKVALYKNSKKASEATLEAANNWTYTWTNLDMYENGKLISYEVKEPNVPSGYKLVGVTGDQTSGFFITNSHTPKGSVRLIKKDTNTGGTLAGATFTLYKSGGTKVGSKTTPASGIIEFTNLEFGDYYFTEDKAPTGYAKLSDNINFTIDSTSGITVPVELEVRNDPVSIHVDGEKVWNDNNNAAGSRPGSIRVVLMRNGVEVPGTVKVVSADSSWSFDFGNLARYDESGRAYRYTVAEEAVDGYEGQTTTDTDGNGNVHVTIVNTPPGTPPPPVTPPPIGIDRKPPTPTPTVDPGVLGARRAVLGAKRVGKVLGARRAKTGDDAMMVTYGALSGSSFAGFWAWILAFFKRKKAERARRAARRNNR